MKRILTLAVILLLALPAQAAPQKRSSPSKKRAPAAPAKQPPSDLRAEAAQVAEQLKLLTRFLYVYAPISAGFKAADEQAKRGETSPAVVERTKQNKARVVSNIRDVRAGLEKLQESFHANERLQRQYLKLLSATEAAATAEQLAASDRFDEAGKVLLNVAERLADVMVDVR